MGALEPSFVDKDVQARLLVAQANEQTGQQSMMEMNAIGGYPKIKERRWMLTSKRVFDLGAVLLSAPLWLPVLLLVALLVKLDSRGKVLFRQERTGLEGRLFHIYKFRTMHQLACEQDSGQQSRREDERHTRIGKWLRRSSLDELPQLLNVLRGDMSLIGPRPHARYHDQLFLEQVPTYHMRFRVRPGLTGLAQVQGHRGLMHTQEQLHARTDADNDYIDRWSVWLDLKILFKTAAVVLKATNAH